MGSSWMFMLAFLVIIAWGASGPVFGFSDTWQLVINTGTTIVTFLMIFLVQNTQNRDAKATHLKLDELLRALKGARTGMVNLEDLPDDELKQLHEQFVKLQEAHVLDETIDEIHDEVHEVHEQTGGENGNASPELAPPAHR